MPEISIVVLSWDGLELTTACVDSLRRNTRAAHEIIIVDNGSLDPVRERIVELADRHVLNPENYGFAVGMNQGLAVVSAPTVVFANNDTVFPPGWDVRLLESLDGQSRAGIVVPAVTAAGNPATVRSEPGETVERLIPFSEPPSGVVYAMRTDLVRRLGGWSIDYEIASGEDWDLCFTVWSEGFEIYLDTRVLVEHVSKGTAAAKLGDWRALWRRNRNRFLEKWNALAAHQNTDRSDHLIATLDWMGRYYALRDELVAVQHDLSVAQSDAKRTIRSLAKKNDELRRRDSLRYQLAKLGRRILRRVRRHRRATSSAPDTTPASESLQSGMGVIGSEGSTSDPRTE